MKRRMLAFLALLITMTGISAFAVVSPAFAADPILGPVRIVTAGKCLDVTGASTSNGALLQLYDCLPNQWNQQWYWYGVPGCFQCVQLVPRHSWKCADVVGASQSTGASVQQFDCLGFSQENQIWQIVYCCNNSYFQMLPIHSYKAMTYTGPPANGAPVVQASTLYWSWSSYLG